MMINGRYDNEYYASIMPSVILNPTMTVSMSVVNHCCSMHDGRYWIDVRMNVGIIIRTRIIMDMKI